MSLKQQLIILGVYWIKHLVHSSGRETFKKAGVVFVAILAQLRAFKVIPEAITLTE